ncbi:hypothetical protein [Acidovorax sp. SRB_24]|uniref:hypothetical protein n=1 Tax=Acidovorax sp. SRB_24 TaxID=1962700 RepID=UPI001F0F1464|nr:hypothetical protein [Acidovorax sp. SRB_24]
MNALAQALAGRSDTLLAERESIYKDLHQRPELSMQEVRTAKIAAGCIETLQTIVSRQVAGAFTSQFGDKACETAPASASEDFSAFGRTWQAPCVFWFVGGTDPDAYAQAKAAKLLNKTPSNHSPKCAPVIHPTLETGLQAMLMTAASVWLGRSPQA